MTKPLRHTPPYSQQFRYIVPREYAGKTILELYSDRFHFRPKEYWIELMAKGDVLLNNQGVEPGFILKEKDIIITKRHDVTEPDVNPHYEILYDQHGVCVINKPAPLPVHPAGRYYKNSLTYILKEQFPEKTFHTIHRLDTQTTGVLILATNRDSAKFIHDQVENQNITKEYGVVAVGNFGDKEFIIDEDVGRISGAHRGFGPDITDAKKAVTKFIPVSKKGNLTFLLAYPITGRTNQIRVHINAAGGYILNDPLYGKSSKDFPLSAYRGPMHLHCHKMTFTPHKNSEPQTFVAEWPEHFLEHINFSDLKGQQ